MKTECGEQTNNAPRNAFGCHGETVVFRDWRLRKGVDAACVAIEETLPVQAQQRFSGDSQCLDIARTNQRLMRCEIQDSFAGRCFRHVALCR
jgi:hypothetical protein